MINYHVFSSRSIKIKYCNLLQKIGRQHTFPGARPCKRIPTLLRLEDVFQARNKTPLHRSMTRVEQDDLIYGEQMCTFSL